MLKLSPFFAVLNPVGIRTLDHTVIKISPRIKIFGVSIINAESIMPWYEISCDSGKKIRCYSSIESAYLDHFSQNIWSVRIKEIRLKPLNSKQLERFLLEILKGLEAGLKLQDVLTYISHHESKSNMALIAKAIKDEISMGEDFNTCFKQLVETSLQGYCDLFIQKSTAEQLFNHLSILYEQISQLRRWVIRLQKSLIYPFFVIQLSLIVWLTSQEFNQTTRIDIQDNALIYLVISLAQLLILYLCQSSLILALVETYFCAFRLNKLFNLLNASLKAGNHLQGALILLPTNFNHKQIKQELLLVYYHLRLGDTYLTSFPTYWFPRESLLALKASCQSGDIVRAIDTASHIHKQRWQKKLKLIETLCPLLGLFIAGIFVSKTLMGIYLPLLNIG
jgi:protein transport protein HofC/type IV pilus assembly protein PilC